MTRPTRQGWLRRVCLLLAALVAMQAGAGAARAEAPARLAGQAPVICKDQRYGLCAGAKCFVFGDVAYCACNVRKGDSISAPFAYGKGDICNLNAQGVGNGFMASTFSLPPQLRRGGNQAIYKCPRTSRANYAKCDGGICFRSTRGERSLGFHKPLGEDGIVCSCPVARANPEEGLQIIGPHPCRREFFRNCDAEFATSDDGAKLFDGSPLGSTERAIRRLYGSVPQLNVCLPETP